MKDAKFYPFEDQPQSDSCWSVSTGPDGRIYAAACCEHEAGGTVEIVRYDDQSDSMETVVNVQEAVGEPADSGRATQCKIHYSFAASESDGILYAATHLSARGAGRRAYRFWGDWKDQERAFPCSYLLAYDTRRDTVSWSDKFIPMEGCRCLALDRGRGQLYAISFPRDHFWIYDLESRRIRDLGRLGTVNSQAIFTDRRGRVFTSNDKGQLVRYDVDTDRLEEIPVFVPHAPQLSGWHCVFYDVVASPDGECVYGVPWGTDPHLFRYWPEDGPYGRMEDLGQVHQERHRCTVVPFGLDHCGGLVFGADGMLYYVTTRWPEGAERRPPARREVGDEVIARPGEGIVVQYDPSSGQRRDFARIGRPGGRGSYCSRAGRDRFGNLFFGQVTKPTPVGLSRLTMDAGGQDLHAPVRTWG